jgi:hypothetical protein
MPLARRQSELSLSETIGKWPPASARWCPPNVVDQGAKKGTKGSKKRQKWHPRRVVVADEKKVDDSDKEYVAAAECGFKSQVRPPTDHFKRLLEAACPNHTYPVKHKLKECAMMKNFLTLEDLTKGKETQAERA